ncbi:MAG: flagellar hook-associated protein FlgK [SAR324 cluster bacterium]|nr:flagellar hook-associated protein FlgK [SAR324 cluster bacterium]
MPALNAALNMGHKALSAQQRAISTTGHNIANMNTDGFTRQRSETISEKPASDGSGGGVRSGFVKQIYDRFAQQKILQEKPKNGVYDSREKFLQKIEVVFSEMEGAGLRKTLNDFWDSWSLLANQPESDAARAKVRDRGDALSARFRMMHNELTTIRNEANGRIAGVVSEVNNLAKQIAELNHNISRAEMAGQKANDARDERNQLLEDMSGLADINWFEGEDGAIQVLIGDHWPLVHKGTTNLLSTSQNGGETGMFSIEGTGSNGSKHDLTNSFRSGELKEVMTIRDHTTVEYLQQLDDMAFGLAHRINRLHATGTGLNHAPNVVKSSFGLNPDAQQQPLPFVKDGILQLHLVGGDRDVLETYEIEVQAGKDSIQDIVQRINETVGDPALLEASLENDGSVKLQAGMGRGVIFGNDETELTLVMGFNNFFESLQGAADMRISDKILKDPNNIATGKDLVPGDNQVALKIATMQTEPTMNDDTMTFDEFYNGILADVGLRIQRNQTDKEHQDALLSQFQEIRDSISSVNLDEEIAQMVQYQKAYEASARFITTVNEMMDTLLRM